MAEFVAAKVRHDCIAVRCFGIAGKLCAFGRDYDAEVTPAGVPRLDRFGDFIDVKWQLRNEDDIRTATNAAGKDYPAGECAEVKPEFAGSALHPGCTHELCATSGYGERPRRSPGGWASLHRFHRQRKWGSPKPPQFIDRKWLPTLDTLRNFLLVPAGNARTSPKMCVAEL